MNSSHRKCLVAPKICIYCRTFTHSFNKPLLSADHKPGAVLDIDSHVIAIKLTVYQFQQTYKQETQKADVTLVLQLVFCYTSSMTASSIFLSLYWAPSKLKLLSLCIVVLFPRILALSDISYVAILLKHHVKHSH